MYIQETRHCPVCNALIYYRDCDDRQEWCDADYYCHPCQVIFTYRYTYAIQSHIVVSTEWLQVPEDAPVFTIGQPVFFKPAHNMNVCPGTIEAIHIDQHTFDYHYHLEGFEPGKWFLTSDLSKGPRDAILLDALYVSIVRMFEPTAQETL